MHFLGQKLSDFTWQMTLGEAITRVMPSSKPEELYTVSNKYFTSILDSYWFIKSEVDLTI